MKLNGKWLFSKRKIYNEQVADWVYKSESGVVDAKEPLKIERLQTDRSTRRA